jgi:cyclohexyl-isocyanide hydratase
VVGRAPFVVRSAADVQALAEEARRAAEIPLVFALCSGVTQLDFTGPHEVFARLPGAEYVLASAADGDIEVCGGIVFTKVRRLAEAERCALICVPGGFGTVEAMEDQELIAQGRRLASGARDVTSVCTGGGVTAGLDMALTVMAEIAGDDYAQSVQLGIEDAPALPFNPGRPGLAPAHVLDQAQRRYERALGAREAAIERAAAHLG